MRPAPTERRGGPSSSSTRCIGFRNHTPGIIGAGGATAGAGEAEGYDTWPVGIVAGAAAIGW